MITVFVPSFREAMLARLFQSMEISQRGSAAGIVVLDNGVSLSARARWPQVRFLPVPVPFVAAQAFNIGFAAFPEDDVVVIGDDSEVRSPYWSRRVEAMFRYWPFDYGLLTFAETTTAAVYGELPPPLKPLEMSVVAMGSGIAIPRRVLRQAGPWDETLIGYGFDDFDYGIRLLHMGYRLGVAGDVLLHTEAQATAWVERLGSWQAVLERQEVNHEVFLRKWRGSLPPKPWVVERPVTADHLHLQRCACLRGIA